MTPQQEYEKQTGEKALYRMKSSDYHTLRYVTWLESKLTDWQSSASLVADTPKELREFISNT